MKKTLPIIIAAIIFAFVLFATITYDMGLYDFTFIKRSGSETGGTMTETTTETTKPSETEDVPDGKVQHFLSSVTQYNAQTDNERLSENYDESSAFVRLNMEITPAEVYSLSSKTVNTPVVTNKGLSLGNLTTYVQTSVERPVTEPYMDYIILETANGFFILDKIGKILSSQVDINTYAPAYTRDKNGNALFKKTDSVDENGIAATSYFYLDENGELQLSDYNEIIDFRGIFANYPSSFGEPSEGYTRSFNEYGFVFTDANGDVASPAYSFMTNFSEGLSAVGYYDEKDKVYRQEFINNQFVSVINVGAQYQTASRSLVEPRYVLPDVYGEDKLGFFYFEYGLCRVRKQEIEVYAKDFSRVADDYEVMLKSDGTELAVPSDYTIVSYSDGMILLEKNGFYGYMNYNGRWVVQPTLTVAKPFYSGLAVVGDGTYYGVIDTEGNYVIPMAFEHIENASCGIITLYSSECGWVALHVVD